MGFEIGKPIRFGDEVGTITQFCEEPNGGLCLFKVEGRAVQAMVPVNLLAAFDALREERDRYKTASEINDGLRKHLKPKLLSADALAECVKEDQTHARLIWEDFRQRFPAGHVLSHEDRELILTCVAMASDTQEALEAYLKDV